jgi:hypothetical protein
MRGPLVSTEATESIMTKKNANKRAARERQAQLGGHYLAHYRQVAGVEDSADEEAVTDKESNQRDDVLRLAAEAGIPRESFDGWDGVRIALYRSLGNTSWVDLGLFAFQITRPRWELFKKKLDDAGLGYETKDPVVEGAWGHRARTEERYSVVVLKAPAVLEDFKVDVSQPLTATSGYNERGVWVAKPRGTSNPVSAPAGGTGKGHELAYNFAAEKYTYAEIYPHLSWFNRAPQRWERASALMFDVYVASPPIPNPPLEVVAFMPLELFVTIEGPEGFGHAVLLGPCWTTVRLAFDDGKWEPRTKFFSRDYGMTVTGPPSALNAIPAFEKRAREFDLSDVEPIRGLTFTLLGMRRKDFGKIFINNITIV